MLKKSSKSGKRWNREEVGLGGTKKGPLSMRMDGGGRGEVWQALQRDVPLETENSPLLQRWGEEECTAAEPHFQNLSWEREEMKTFYTWARITHSS